MRYFLINRYMDMQPDLGTRVVGQSDSLETIASMMWKDIERSDNYFSPDDYVVYERLYAGYDKEIEKYNANI